MEKLTKSYFMYTSELNINETNSFIGINIIKGHFIGKKHWIFVHHKGELQAKMWHSSLQNIMPFRHVPLNMQIQKRNFHNETINVLNNMGIPPENLITTKKFQNTNFINKNKLMVQNNYNQMKIEEPKEMTKKNSKRNKRNKKKTEGEEEESVGTSNCIDIVQIRTPCIETMETTLSISPSAKLSRTKNPSICESEDSFIICFEDDNSLTEDESSDSDTSDCSNTAVRKVRFADDKNLCQVHMMVQWSYAYQAARKGPWEEYARDRVRFKTRITNTEALLMPILQSQHRQTIYKKRFEIDESQ